MRFIITALIGLGLVTSIACSPATIKKDATIVATEVVDCVNGKAKDPVCALAEVVAGWVEAHLVSAHNEALVTRSIPEPSIDDVKAGWAASHPGKTYHTAHGDI